MTSGQVRSVQLFFTQWRPDDPRLQQCNDPTSKPANRSDAINPFQGKVTRAAHPHDVIGPALCPTAPFLGSGVVCCRWSFSARLFIQESVYRWFERTNWQALLYIGEERRDMISPFFIFPTNHDRSGNLEWRFDHIQHSAAVQVLLFVRNNYSLWLGYSQGLTLLLRYNSVY